MIDDNTIIWRYFDSSKFKDLLETSEIFLCRADKLKESDPYEGIFDLRSYLHLEVAKQIFMPPEITDLLKQGFLEIYKKIFINCWCINKEESYLMWRSYANEGFAIKTTIGKLKKSLLKNENLQNLVIDKIHYYNLKELKDLEIKNQKGCNDESSKNPFELMFLRKLNFFQDEKELRIILSDFESQTVREEMRLKCNLSDLIEEIYISPLLKSKTVNQVDENIDIENLIKNELDNLELKTSYISKNLIYNYQVQDEDLIKLIPEVISSSSIGKEAREAKYRVKYCPNSGNILGFYPTNIKYNNNNIDDEKRVIDGYPFIVIDWKEWQKCINNQQKYKVDLYKNTLMKE